MQLPVHLRCAAGEPSVEESSRPSKISADGTELTRLAAASGRVAVIDSFGTGWSSTTLGTCTVCLPEVPNIALANPFRVENTSPIHLRRAKA